MATNHPPSSARSTAAEGERRPAGLGRSSAPDNPGGSLAGDAARREAEGASRGSSSAPGQGEGDFESALMGTGERPGCAQPADAAARAAQARDRDVTDARPGGPGTDYRAPADHDPPADGSTRGSTE